MRNQHKAFSKETPFITFQLLLHAFAVLAHTHTERWTQENENVRFLFISSDTGVGAKAHTAQSALSHRGAEIDSLNYIL